MKIERLTYNEKQHAIEVLVSAFQDYPVMRYILKDSRFDYDKHLKELVGFFCETRLTRDWPLLGLYSEKVIVAVAGINEPISKPCPETLHRKYERLKRVIGDEAILRMEAYESQSNALEPGFPHFYLGIIGVVPGQQRKGHARFLIQKLIDMSHSDPDSKGICLNTERKENVTFYEHLGFEVIGEEDVGELHTWSMYRADSET